MPLATPGPRGRRLRARRREEDDAPALRLLLAEDDDALREALAETLVEEGYEVVEVADGYAFLEAIDRYVLEPDEGEAVDVIITDIKMPGPWGGFSVATLRQMHEEIPVIVITALTDPEVHEELRRLNPVSVIPKPFEYDELREALESLFED